MSISTRVLIFSAVALVSATATGDTRYQSGISCRRTALSPAPYFLYSTGGAANPSGAAQLWTLCPIHWFGGSSTMNSSTTTTLYYRDGSNETVSNYGDLVCNISAEDNFANVFIGSVRHSCSTAGGCTTADPAFVSTGASYLSLPGITSSTGWVSYSASCTVPRYSGGGSRNMSYVTSP
jgi:hypothetical protein